MSISKRYNCSIKPSTIRELFLGLLHLNAKHEFGHPNSWHGKHELYAKPLGLYGIHTQISSTRSQT